MNVFSNRCNFSELKKYIDLSTSGCEERNIYFC